MKYFDQSARLASIMAEPSRDVPGDPARLARVESTRTEMLNQGHAIRETLKHNAIPLAEYAQKLADSDLKRVVIIGCGDSWHVGVAIRHAIESLTGWPVEAAQALDFAAYGFLTVDTGTLVLGLSSGGNTPAVMAALEAAHLRGATCIGLSNTAGSPILTRFNGGLEIVASRKGWPTQSSTAAMALLIQMAATFASARGIAGALMPADTVKALGDLPALVEDVASTCDASVREAAEQMASASLIIFTGLGPNLGAAAIGAAKIRELSTIHAISYPLEEMHHYRAQKRGDLVVLVATDSAARERALDTALVSEAVRGRLIAILAMEDPDIEARAAHVIRVPPVQPWLTGLVSCVPLHVFAYHFAKARDAAGLGYSGVW